MSRTNSSAEPPISANSEADRGHAGQPPILRDLAARAAAFVILATASTALMALPYLADGHASEERDSPAARVAQGFEVAGEASVRQELIEAMAAIARRTDKLSAAAPCGAQTWPDIASGCLVGAGDQASDQRIRTVTIQYRLGANSSALVRIPVQQLAAQ
jgi:hypothetical protein